ncbi:MAG: RluA family pseudouridine synthase [bacterium]
MVDILYEDNHVIVAYKPANMLSQQDCTNDKDILTVLKQYIKTKYNKPNEVFLGLLHRLDRMTSGVMVFARTSKAASRISEDIKNHKFYKEYIAIVEGTLPLNSKKTIELFMSKDEKNNKSFVDSKGKQAILEYEVLEVFNNKTKVKVNLKTGRHHQIRVTFSYLGHPLVGDIKYGSKYKEDLNLKAYKLSFHHPITKELMTFERE